MDTLQGKYYVILSSVHVGGSLLSGKKNGQMDMINGQLFEGESRFYHDTYIFEIIQFFGIKYTQKRRGNLVRFYFLVGISSKQSRYSAVE